MANKDIALSVLGVGMGCIAVYLEVNGLSSSVLWCAMVFCFMSVIG